MKKLVSPTKKALRKAVAQSSKMEGLSLAKAEKNKIAIKLLKKYGRSHSL